MQKVVKCKLGDMDKGQFYLVEALLIGDVIIHWMEFKHVETMHMSKNLYRTDTAPNGIYLETFKLCLQELKKHYLLKTLACLQKAYLCNHIKKLNKLSIKNTPVWLCDVNSMLVHFPAPGNNLMVEDELCDIIYPG
eukprot:9287144-Ditylum_brightwellii.AAC.1